MTSVDSPALELLQTRDLTSPELRAVSHDWSRLVHDKISSGAWYRVLAYLTYAFLGFLVLSMARAVFAIDQDHPYLAPQLALALTGCVASWAAADFYSRALQRRIYWNHYRGGDRYIIGGRGIQMASPVSHYDLLWEGISNIVDNEQRLVLITNKFGAAFILKNAFEHQDVETFCAELVRRWQANRNTPQPESAA